MREVRVIPATPEFVTNHAMGLQIQKRRVAGYARVSTDSADQYASYEAQVDYYTTMIKANAEWEFVDIYTDEGISGTSTARREGFRRMIDDALAGKIDLIITKSVSRFARNTVDSLSTIRKLKEHKVEVMFEKEGIRTFDSKGELLITIMSSLAQEESRSISENVKWGIRKRFADGQVSVNYTRFLGFKKGEDGKLAVNHEQAKVVRRIYYLFLQGKNFSEIARQLESEGYTTVTGRKRWSPTTIKRVLTNVKYKGDALLQIHYTADFLTKKPVLNRGEVPQYYVKNNHEAIIEPNIFDMVQKEIEERAKNTEFKRGNHIFSGFLRCGGCGANFGPKVWHSNEPWRKEVWQCNDKYRDRSNICTIPHCTEKCVQDAFVKAVNKALDDKEKIIGDFALLQNEVFDTALEEKKLEKAHERRSETITLMSQLAGENARSQLDQRAYQERFEQISSQYTAANKRITDLEEAIQDKRYRKAKAELFMIELKKQGRLITKFSESLWHALSDYVTVYAKDDIRVMFKNGMEMKA